MDITCQFFTKFWGSKWSFFRHPEAFSRHIFTDIRSFRMILCGKQWQMLSRTHWYPYVVGSDRNEVVKNRYSLRRYFGFYGNYCPMWFSTTPKNVVTLSILGLCERKSDESSGKWCQERTHNDFISVASGLCGQKSILRSNFLQNHGLKPRFSWRVFLSYLYEYEVVCVALGTET